MIDLSTITAVGFDLDHCLARYALPSFQKLIYDLTVDALLSQLPASSHAWLKHSAPYDVALGIKGMIYDKQFGNMLTISADGTILVAYHGHHRMTQEEQITTYGLERRFPIASATKERCYHCGTYFEIAVTRVFLDWVSWIDHGGSDHGETYGSLMNRLFGIYDLLYDDMANSPLYKAMYGNMEYYLLLRPNLNLWLREHRLKTFLVSNSRWEYVRLVCRHLFGGGWEDMFDVVVCNAHKPAFFDPNCKTPFQHIRKVSPGVYDRTPMSLISHISGECVEAGNVRQLQHSLLGPDDKVLFFEDSLNGGAAVKRHTNWSVGMVVEEVLSRPNISVSPYFGNTLNDSTPSSHWQTEVNAVSDLVVGCLESLPNLFRQAQRALLPPQRYMYVVKCKDDTHWDPPIAILPSNDEADRLALKLNTRYGVDSDDDWKEYQVYAVQVPYVETADQYVSDDDYDIERE